MLVYKFYHKTNGTLLQIDDISFRKHPHLPISTSPAIDFPPLLAITPIMPGRIQDRIALVTGGSSGLGRAICLKLASEGAKICCVDLYDSPRNQTNPETGKADDYNNRIEGESTCAEISRLHGEGRAAFVKADITKAEDVEAAVAECVKTFGRVSLTSTA